MSLARELWQANADLAQRTLAHDFVQGLGNGRLPLASFKRYLAQDAYFLEAFARAYASCLALSTSRDDLNAFAALIAGVIEELKLHAGYAARWGVDLATTSVAPATRAYTDFLRDTATEGDIGVTAAAMTPCMRLYAFLGQQLAGGKVADLYAEWVRTYASAEFEALAVSLEELLDRHVVERSRAAVAYRRAMQLEYQFFDANL